MITWRDSLGLSRKRWKRKRIFGSVKYSAPLFLLTLLTIVTINVTYVLVERLREFAMDTDSPRPGHLLVTTLPKAKDPLTAAQLQALRTHPAVRHAMAAQTWLGNFYADMGEVRYTQTPYLVGYSPEFFNLYRTLPPEKCDPASVPVLLGRDLLALSWEPQQKKFVRNGKAEMQRWLGRTFTIYPGLWASESYDPKFTTAQLDYNRYRQEVIDKRRQALLVMARDNPELSRLQDALSVKVQVVGFVRDPSGSGLNTVLPEEVAARVAELSTARRGKKYKPPGEDWVTSINLLVAPGREAEIATLAGDMGLKVYDSTNSVVAELFRVISDEPAARLTIFLLGAFYGLTMMVIIYQLLSGQVKDAIREIGLLRCIGARRRDIMRIFVVMNLLRLGRIYLSALLFAYLTLLAVGFWLAGSLNFINPESLAKGNIPDFLITGMDHFFPSWLMGPWWLVPAPLLLLVPIALAAAALPIWHAMGVQPAEALKD